MNPSATTSYTLTATNAAGSNTATITVAVETQLPVITDFWSNPVQIASGQTATLSWFVSQADSLSLDNGIGTVTGTSWSVSPTATTTYTLTATNLIGSVTATVTVSVGAPGALVWKKTMVYGFGQELAEDQPGMGTTFIQSDFVGSPSITTDPSGTVIGRSKNLPFGERYGQWGQKTVRRYTNHEDDSDSNAIYMQAREYLPAYGKFAQVDPAYDQTKDDPESWNLYNYTTNNPVTHTDPDGRMAPTMLSPAQKAMLEDTGSAMGSDGSLWTVQAEGGGDLSGEVTNSTQPSASDGTSVSPGGVDANASANGGSGTGAGQQAAAPAPAPSTPAQTKKEAAKQRRLEKWHKNYKKLSDKQVANIVYNETRSLDGDKAHEARVDVAATVINGDDKAFDNPGHPRPQTASDKAKVPKAEQSTYDDSKAAVSEARGKLASGQDPTNGATHFNLRNGDSKNPFQGHDLHTQSGPLDNSFPTNALKGDNIYVNTYE